jgi:hypothetical protein
MEWYQSQETLSRRPLKIIRRLGIDANAAEGGYSGLGMGLGLERGREGLYYEE